MAIDQGTHASRALVLDRHGRRIAAQLLPVTLARPRAGHIEHDSAQLLESVNTVIDAVLNTLTGAQRRAVTTCGLCTQRSTVLAWRHDGTPLTPALSWQDTRGAARLGALQQHAGAVKGLSGLPLSAHYGASKLHWLNHACRGEQNLWLGPLAAFLLQRLTGSTTCQVDHSNAQRMQLLDIHSRRWSAQLLEWFQVPLARLPAVAPVIGDYGCLTDYAIPVTATCGDQNAAWFGDGAPERGTALINLGSGAFVLADLPPGVEVPGLLTSIAISQAQACRYLAEGTVNGAGNALQWLQQQFPDSDIGGGLAHWLRQDITPPLFINSIGGLGSPWWETGLKPAFHPDTAQASPAVSAVAVTESILFMLNVNLELIQQRLTLHGLRVSGGLSRLDPLCQKLANLTGLPVTRSPEREASARGVAWLAAGQPVDWPPAAPDARDRFEAKSDPHLITRYRRFGELLQRRLDAHRHA